MTVPTVSVETPLDLEGAADADGRLSRLLAYAAAHLAAGPPAHRDLYRTFDRLRRESASFRALFDVEQDGARSLFPVIRFLVEREQQMGELAETVFRAAAEEPAFFDGTAPETLETFAEGLGPLLPGMVSAQRLERVRAAVKAALALPEEGLPKALAQARPRLQRLLDLWVPALSSAEATERLRSGQATGREALALLRRVNAADRRALDLVSLLGPFLDQGDVKALTPALLAGLDARTLDALDARLLDAMAHGLPLTDWHLLSWLEASGRVGWEQRRGFVEQAFARGGTVADAAGLLLLRQKPAPPPAEVAELISRHPVGPKVDAALRQAFGLR